MPRVRNRHGVAPPRRRRRTAGEARHAILKAAERRLVDGGPDAVRFQVVARDVGLTDAAVHHHFGSREGLLEELLRFAGRRLKRDLEAATERWNAESLDLAELADRIATTYDELGYARLTAWMALAGWQPTGAGMYTPLAETIHAARAKRGGEAPSVEDTLFLVALLNLVVWADSLVGGAFRRSVGLPANRATALGFRSWLVALLEDHLA